VGVINDGDESLSFTVEVTGFFDEASFALVIATVSFEFHGMTEEA